MKNLFAKKAVALILAMAMVLSLGSFSVFAETEPVVDTSVLGLVSTSTYVRVQSDSILVLSHYNDSRYYINSGSDAPANTNGNPAFGLFGVLSSAEGYTLSYVNADKTAPESVVSSVKNGYVLCQKEGAEDVYVPIVHKGAEVVYTNPNATNMDSQPVENGDVSALAGKAESDSAKYIAVTGENAVASGKFARYEYSLTNVVGSSADAFWSFETNIYADGDAIVQVNLRTNAIMQWLPDGSVMAMNATSQSSFADAVVVGNLERGKWHRLVIGYDCPRNRAFIFADGARLSNTATPLSGIDYSNSVRIGLAAGSANGMVAVDDLVAYKGYYSPADDKISFTSTSDITLNTTTDTLTVNGDSFADVAACNAALKSAFGGTYAALLKSDLTPASSFNEAECAIVTSATGRVYEYYNVTVNQSLAGMIGLSSSSNYVRVMDDSILVMSHYDDKRYFIHSDASTPADNTESGDVSFGLFSVLTSSNGYTLSYVDANKNAPEEVVKSVKDGYVLCQKDGEADVYIPIVHHGDEIKYAEHSYGYVAGAGAAKSTVGSLAGKSASDTANVISIGETAVSGGAFPRFQLPLSSITKDGTDTTCDEPISFETNIYADGDVILQISVRTYTVLQWRANGEVWGYNTTESTADFSGKATKIGELERGKWHRLTVGYDLNRNRVVIFADGVRLTNLGSRALSQTEQLNDTLRIGLADGSANGKIAVDDCVGYKGYYYTSDDTVTFTGTENMKLGNSVLTVNKDAYSDIQSLIEAIKSAFGTTYASLLKSDLTAASTFDEAKILVVTSSTGRAYKYYNLNFTDAEGYNLVVEETFSADTPEDANISNDIKVQFYTFATNPVQSYHGAAMAGIGTKADDDYAYVITSSNETITSGYNTPQIDLNRTVNATERYLTLEFDVYKETMNVNAAAFVVTDTDTGARINVVDFLGNSEVKVGGLTHVMDHEVKRWYKVACVIDTEEDTWSIYINGKLMEVLSKENTTKNLAVESINRFAVHAYYPPELTAEEIAAAKTAIDNYRIYTTSYNPAGDIADITVNAPYVLDSVNSLIVADSIEGIKKADVASIINTNGLDYKVFADSSYQAELADDDAVTEDTVIVLYSKDGESYGYYRFSTPFVDKPLLSVLTGTNEIMAVGFTNDVSYEYDLIIAEYTGDEMTNVNLTKVVPYERNETVIPYKKGCIYKAFVWIHGTAKPASLSSVFYTEQ